MEVVAPLGHRARGGRANEKGAATAELAVLLPALTLLIGLVVFGAHVGLTQLRIDDAARAGARVAARGEGTEAVRSAVLKIAGPAAVSVSSQGDFIVVTVTAAAAGPFADLAGWQLKAQATARTELWAEPSQGSMRGAVPRQPP